MDWGRPPATVHILLSTKRLSALVAHEYHDLTATAQAGARIADVNRELARHGQWLPIESPFEDTTIGGAIATNDSGPLRHRYGTPRDVLIGIRLALTDGRVIKAGGNVVKNVAGYDLGKLMSGSHGSLAAIASATFKLTPLPGASTTLVARFDDAGSMLKALEGINGSQLESSACEIRAGIRDPGSGIREVQLLLKFESTPGALSAHVQRARGLVGSAICDVVASEAEAALWREHARALWDAPGAVVRAAWLPASLGGVLAFIDKAGAEIELAGRAAIGAGLLRIGDDAATQRRVIDSMRRGDLFRHVVVLRASSELKQTIDVWGELGDAGRLGASVKRMLDPNGILNAGRGPV